MNWLDGLTLTWYWHGCGFKFWRTQISFGLNVKSWRKT